MADQTNTCAHDFLKDDIRQKVNFSMTDQSRGVTPPSIQKTPLTDQPLISLPQPEEWQGLLDHTALPHGMALRCGLA